MHYVNEEENGGIFFDKDLLTCLGFNSNSVALKAAACSPDAIYEQNGSRSFWKRSNEEISGTKLIYGVVIFDDEVDRYKEIMERLEYPTEDLKYETPLKSSYWKPSSDIKCDRLNFPIRTQEYFDDLNTYRYFDDIINFEYLLMTTPQVEPKSLKIVSF